MPLEEIRSGGPPLDGIPPIDRPVFETVAGAGEWLAPQDPVLIVDHARIVNDIVAGQPLLVTYCTRPKGP